MQVQNKFQTQQKKTTSPIYKLLQKNVHLVIIQLILLRLLRHFNGLISMLFSMKLTAP
ncbi:uncharacterized protein METZ01_LOCUS167843 [marine metagenome]|uniref:Uncharacterized protein n=1 Tax=marine metagenome TaxID=408172 RepID=A0A382BMY7_9ZZZZ